MVERKPIMVMGGKVLLPYKDLFSSKSNMGVWII
jgi:hypothetical protein